MLNIRYTNKFKADYKQVLKRGKKEDKLRKVIELLANRIIEPDWLLIYEIIDDELILNL